MVALAVGVSAWLACANRIPSLATHAYSHIEIHGGGYSWNAFGAVNDEVTRKIGEGYFGDFSNQDVIVSVTPESIDSYIVRITSIWPSIRTSDDAFRRRIGEWTDQRMKEIREEEQKTAEQAVDGNPH